MDDMCYDRRRAEACVDESARHALANAGGREIVGKKEGEQKGSARGSVHWGCVFGGHVTPRCSGLVFHLHMRDFLCQLLCDDHYTFAVVLTGRVCRCRCRS